MSSVPILTNAYVLSAAGIQIVRASLGFSLLDVDL